MDAISDPSISPLDTAHLLSPATLSSLAATFHPSRPTSTSPYSPNTSDTVYLAVTDAQGNACSFVNSIADVFGSLIIPPGTGFVLQSRGSGFHLHPPSHPNVFAPGKRPYNTIIPAMVTNCSDGSLHTVLGVMGGAMQPQGHAQVLLNIVKFGLDPQRALDAPRICVGAALPGKSTSDDPSKKVDETVYLEDGIHVETAKRLGEMGYQIKIVEGWSRSLFGRGQIITVKKDGATGESVCSAGSDMRGDGCAGALHLFDL
jgi:gamma-glutamyltranspeptidase/glutathione hydrolase